MVLPTKKTYERVLLKGTSPRRETITPKTVLPKKVLRRIPPKTVIPTKKTYERGLLKGTSPRRETITKKTYERGLLKGTSPRRETITPKTVLPTKKTYENGKITIGFSMPGKPIWLYSTFVAQKRNPRQSHRSPHDSKATGTNATMSCTNFLYIWIWKEGKSLKEIAWTVQVNRQQERRLGSTLRKKAHT